MRSRIKGSIHYVLGHTNFWKKQEKILQFFLTRCILVCLNKRKTKGFEKKNYCKFVEFNEE